MAVSQRVRPWNCFTLQHAQDSNILYPSFRAQGFAPKLNVNAYIKLLPMLAGIGSPGTVGEVLRGYVGDRNAKQIFDSPSSFDVLGKGYQRPFELATLRLNNMIQILNHCTSLPVPNFTNLLLSFPDHPNHLSVQITFLCAEKKSISTTPNKN